MRLSKARVSVSSSEASSLHAANANDDESRNRPISKVKTLFFLVIPNSLKNFLYTIAQYFAAVRIHPYNCASSGRFCIRRIS